MKYLLKYAFLLCFTFICLEGYSVKIFMRDASGGGVNGYNSVSITEWEVTLPIPGLLPALWPTITYKSINCRDAGYETCPAEIAYGGGNTYDPTDVSIVNELIDFANLQIVSNNLEGSHYINSQVTGENFLRVYTVTWIKNGDSIHIEVDRTNNEL